MKVFSKVHWGDQNNWECVTGWEQGWKLGTGTVNRDLYKKLQGQRQDNCSWGAWSQTKKHNNGLQVLPTIWFCDISEMGTHAQFE